MRTVINGVRFDFEDTALAHRPEVRPELFAASAAASPTHGCTRPAASTPTIGSLHELVPIVVGT